MFFDFVGQPHLAWQPVFEHKSRVPTLAEKLRRLDTAILESKFGKAAPGHDDDGDPIGFFFGRQEGGEGWKMDVGDGAVFVFLRFIFA